MEKEDLNALFCQKLFCFYSNQEGTFITFWNILFYNNKADIISFPMTYDEWGCAYNKFVMFSPKNNERLIFRSFSEDLLLGTGISGLNS